MAQHEPAQTHLDELIEKDQLNIFYRRTVAELKEKLGQATSARSDEAGLRARVGELIARIGRRDAEIDSLKGRLAAEEESVAGLEVELAVNKSRLNDGRPRDRLEPRIKTDPGNVVDLTEELKALVTGPALAMNRQLSAPVGPSNPVSNQRDSVFQNTKFVLSWLTNTKPVLCDQDDKPLRLDQYIEGSFKAWDSYRGGHWSACISGDRYNARSVSCVYTTISQLSPTQWPEDGAGRFACGHCVRFGMVCFRKIKDKFYALPLQPSDRVRELDDNEVCVERWVVPEHNWQLGRREGQGRLPGFMVELEESKKRRRLNGDEDDD